MFNNNPKVKSLTKAEESQYAKCSLAEIDVTKPLPFDPLEMLRDNVVLTDGEGEVTDRTSMALELPFWLGLNELARREGKTRDKLISEIWQSDRSSKNLASSVRTVCMLSQLSDTEFRNKQAADSYELRETTTQFPSTFRHSLLLIGGWGKK